MKLTKLGIFSVIVVSSVLTSFSAQATPGDGYCEGEKDGKKYSILIGRHAVEPHPDDFEEVSIDGQPVIRFLESAFDFAMKNVSTPEIEFYLNSRIAKNADGEIELVYPEQDPEGDEWYINMSLKVPGKSIDVQSVEMVCRN